jgi:hypothetical protein
MPPSEEAGFLATDDGSAGLFLPDEQFSLTLDNIEATVTIVSALDQLILTQESTAPEGTVFVAPNLNLVVSADTVIVRGPLSFPGQTVTIVARVVGSEPDAEGNPAKIDVSGTDATPPSPDEPKQPQAAQGSDGSPGGGDGGPGSPGAAGTPGTTGNSGGDAGTITLSTESFQQGTNIAFVANGGVGGSGQDGQAGQDGGVGGDGSADGFARGSGGDGGPGGNGGTGGDGGGGGSAGLVAIGAILATEFSLTVSAQGGNGGTGGNGGDGGNGGQPGEGSLVFTPPPQPGQGGLGGGAGNGGNAGNGGPVPFNSFGINSTINVEAGMPGAAGTLGNPQPPGGSSSSGSFGTAGGGATGDLNYNMLATHAVPAQLSMTLQKAKLLYLTADPDVNPTAYATAATLLAWLQNVTQVFTTTAPPPGFTPDDVTVMASINSHAAGVAHQMTLKRDFFGNLPSFVPQGSFTFYQGQLASMLGDGGTFTAIENNYLAYNSALQAQDATLDQFAAAQS